VPPLPPAGGEIGLYNVMAMEEYISAFRADADKQIDQILREQIPKGVQASKVVKEGDAATEILKAVENLQIDLVTIATHGRTGWHHLVFGSVAEKVIRMCKVPVLTVREKVIESEKPE
jgi:nucleotide-binding universal stress UspA family protein